MPHSHEVTTCQPINVSASLLCWSRKTLRRNFASQYSLLRFGKLLLQRRQRCQKHPWMKTATFALPKTMSGFPGKSPRWTRYPLAPIAQSCLRSATSGPVSLDTLARIRRAVQASEAVGAFTRSVFARRNRNTSRNQEPHSRNIRTSGTM